MEDKKILVTLNDLENAFYEWDRRYSEDRDQFDRDMAVLLKTAPKRHALVCALYLLKLVEETGEQEATDHLEI